MKLELKHIAPYLPYGVKCHIQGENKKNKPVLFEIQQLNNGFAECHEVDGIYILETYFHDIFPILRPLSDLTKEIEHNGEKFVPMDILCNEFSQYDCFKFDNVNILNNPYNQIQNLLEWHFDVFGLHEKGLCIYYNEF